MRVIAVSIAAGLASAALAAPVTAVIPTVKVPTGRLVVAMDEGCLARVIDGRYRVNVPTSGRMLLPAGKYKLTVRPGTCTANKKTVKVRKGKTTRATVINKTPAD